MITNMLFDVKLCHVNCKGIYQLYIFQPKHQPGIGWPITHMFQSFPSHFDDCFKFNVMKRIDCAVARFELTETPLGAAFWFVAI
jgi:hypothetical protein